jgi:hypothetical protein
MARVHPLADLPCLPESRLPRELLDALPASTPAPPWECRVHAVVWVQRAPSPLPSSSRFAGRVRSVAMGAVVDYLESPVGPYREVFGGQLLRGTLLPVVHVPFIAVDSLPSVHGGRAHWALPKTVAQFAGDIGAGRAGATGDGWSVDVAAQARGPQLPVRWPLVSQQDDRRAVVWLRGRARLAQVRVTATGPTLGGWLGTGSHVGAVAHGTMLVTAPR